jgi:hypothetical protein
VGNSIDLSTADAESELAQFLAEVANRIERGEYIDIAVCCSQHPRWSEEVRALLPVLEQLSSLWSRTRRSLYDKQGKKHPPDFSFRPLVAVPFP